jgi:hypothetical protein
MFKSTNSVRAGAPRVVPRGAASNPYHAVEICGGPTACAKAQHSAGHRYLSRETPPTLPLSQCDRPGQCACRYLHHDDRRAGPRRSAENGRPFTPWFQGERRARRGRRKDD